MGLLSANFAVWSDGEQALYEWLHLSNVINVITTRDVILTTFSCNRQLNNLVTGII